MTVHLYFPATVLMQHVDATSIQELEQKIRDGKVSVLGTLLRKDTHEDIHTTVVMPYILKRYFRDLRSKLARMILGKDVILFFRRDFPIEIEAEEEYELVFQMDPVIANRLRIRKFAVAERFLITDMVFRLYYHIAVDIKSRVKEIRSLESKITTFRQSAQYEARLAEFTPFEFPVHKMIMNVHYPGLLAGFMESNFPLLSKSGVLQMAIMFSVKERRFEEFSVSVSDDFVSECDYHFDVTLNRYINSLDRFITEVRAIVEERDLLEEFVLSNLPATFFDIYEKAKAHGYNVDEVVLKLKDLIRRGVVKTKGEMLTC